MTALMVHCRCRYEPMREGTAPANCVKFKRDEINGLPDDRMYISRVHHRSMIVSMRSNNTLSLSETSEFLAA